MQYEKHKVAKIKLKSIEKIPQNHLIIHYSCESFYDIKDGRTPRITSIAVYNFETAQTDSFAIHKTAEKKHVPFKDIQEKYDELELSMLEEFFIYINSHKEYVWVHWNMRDINFGFQAIEHRFEVLGGKPVVIDSIKKIDLARLLIKHFGTGYINHPRMEMLIDYNNISSKDYLAGKEEAIAFEKQEYIKLHRSTLRKVDIMANILHRTIDGTLKVKSKWSEIYGVSPQSIFEMCKSKWWIQLIWTVILLITGGIIGRLLG